MLPYAVPAVAGYATQDRSKKAAVFWLGLASAFAYAGARNSQRFSVLKSASLGALTFAAAGWLEEHYNQKKGQAIYGTI